MRLDFVAPLVSKGRALARPLPVRAGSLDLYFELHDEPPANVPHDRGTNCKEALSIMKVGSSLARAQHLDQGEDIITTRSSRRLRLLLTVFATIVAMALTPFMGSARASSTGWKFVSPTISYHVSGAAAIGQNGKIYVFGGRSPTA